MQTKAFCSVAKLAALSALVVGLIQPAAAIGILDSAPFGGHNYYLLDTSNWTDAENQAISLGGHLVTINDAAENNFIFTRWAATRSLWIGLNDAAVEGSFVWASGQAVSFTNWRSGEPNNGLVIGGNEDYAYIMAAGFSESPGQWNDYQNLSTIPGQPPLFGVVEVVPEPTGAILFAAGTVVW